MKFNPADILFNEQFFKLLHEMVEESFINVQKHPEADFYLYNYSAKTQYERVWNEATIMSRGLIFDGAQNLIARPFAKFFNLEEHDPSDIPIEPFKVFDKMDGSLGVLYFYNGEPFIATRGSFKSEQAIKATEMLKTTYKDAISKLKQDQTYLFEIVYPENRIVLDYGSEEALFLLGVIDHKTGYDLPLEEIGFPLVKSYDGIRDINELKALEEDNREGFVIRFESSFRLKVKFEEYKRLHRILTQISSLTIWELLKDNKSLEEILDAVPDEFYDWVRATEKELKIAFKEIEDIAKAEFKVLDTRKETAFYYSECSYPKILFKMLDEQDYSQLIWREIRPSFEKPFTNSQEEDL